MPVAPDLDDKQMLTTVWQLLKKKKTTAKWLALMVAAWPQTFPIFLAQCPCRVHLGSMGTSLVGVSE